MLIFIFSSLALIIVKQARLSLQHGLFSTNSSTFHISSVSPALWQPCVILNFVNCPKLPCSFILVNKLLICFIASSCHSVLQLPRSLCSTMQFSDVFSKLLFCFAKQIISWCISFILLSDIFVSCSI